MIQAIVFDLDGVVVQSEKLKTQAYAMAVQRLRGLSEPDPRAIESTFDPEEWQAALAEAGLRVEGPLRSMPLWDICGVATKNAGERS